MPLATKNLAIREEVYRKLSDAKKPGESFSDVIDRILENRANLLSLSGVLAGSSNVIEIERESRRIRRLATVRV
jgi:predicted CopG family antitoxin